MSEGMTISTDTVIVGGGQAGFAVSYHLGRRAHDHLLFEQAGKPAEAWRNHRWDSFTLNTPNWQSRLPGASYTGSDPDGFMSRKEIVAYFENYARRFSLPIRYSTRVSRVERNSRSGMYLVAIEGGAQIQARNVVIATGLYQEPKIPPFSADFPAGITQLHSDAYRNPQELPPGAVLVVGSAQSGAQIAEELHESGRKVFLATGCAGRTPRRYRGKDANWWHDKLGDYDKLVSELPSPKAKFAGKPIISGTRGGHTLNLHQFARDGVSLVGHLRGVRDGKIEFAPDLYENLSAADRSEADFVKRVDAYIARTGMAAPEETLPAFRDGFAQPILTELDLKASGITNVIWATGYSFDFSLVRLPVTDGDGFPIQTRGVTAFPGLFFVGLPWLHTAKSGLIYGLGEDARYIADRIAQRRDAAEGERATALLPEQSGSLEPKRSSAARQWAGRAAMLASAAIVSLALTASHAAEAPLPPHVNLLATPASQLHLGMTADDVIRVMGQAARATDVTTGATQIRKLEFTGAIPSQVILSNGKVSRLTLDAFPTEQDAIPPSLGKAWPGFAMSSVRRALGEPAAVVHHTFFGIAVDQWIYTSAGVGDVSVFFRDDRVIAKTVGRHAPADLFQVDLPSPPLPESEDPMREPRVGMTARDARDVAGSLSFRVDYVLNGQSASREVYESRSNEAFVAFTFIDGVMTEFEDLGQMPADASFQGR
jgi:putative flavoprotein involved in K+ transport